MKHDPSFWKKELYCGAFRLYLGGQYTEAIVMGLCWPFTWIIVACSLGLAYGSCSEKVIVDRMRIAVPPCAFLSGWFVWQKLYPGIEKYDLVVKCVSLTNMMSIWFYDRNSLISSLWFWSPLAFQCSIRSVF